MVFLPLDAFVLVFLWKNHYLPNLCTSFISINANMLCFVCLLSWDTTLSRLHFFLFFFLIEFAVCCCSSCSQSSTWREDSRFVCSTWGQNYTYCSIDAGPGENVVMAGSSQIVTATAEGNLGNKTCSIGRLFCCIIHHIQFSWQIPVRTTLKQSSLPIQLETCSLIDWDI